MMMQFVHLLAFFSLKGPHPLQHFVEVYLVAVKLRPVDADELCLSAHGDAAGPAHSRSVDHNGVERYVGRYVVLLGQQTHELHHDSRSDCETFVHVFALNHALDPFGHQPFAPVTSVVGHHDDLIGRTAHFFFKNNKFLRATGQHADHPVSGGFQCLHDGEHRSDADASACTDHGAKVLNVGGLS